MYFNNGNVHIHISCQIVYHLCTKNLYTYIYNKIFNPLVLLVGVGDCVTVIIEQVYQIEHL